MYERFYGLRERPFSLTPDPDYLFAGRVHSEALNYLRFGIEGQAGFVVITGEIGSGKTTLLQTVLRNLDRQTAVSRLVNTMLDARELIEAIMLDFGLSPAAGSSKPMLLRDLARFLVDQRVAGRLALLVIDEAQNLTPAALEEVRMLSNLETEKSKLIQIVLIGQPNLRDMLARPELEQLRQRVTVSYHLTTLDADETGAYINHRLRRAAVGAPMQMGNDVTQIIHAASGGLPRKINIIADAVLLFGYGEDKRIIDPALTRDVLDELESTGVLTVSGGVSAPPPAAVAPAVVAQEGRRAPSPAPLPSAPIPSPAMAAAARTAAQLVADRERDVAAREANLVAREKEFAEKRRVLVEGFALLRQQRDMLDPNRATAAPGGWLPARPAGTLTAPAPSAPAPSRPAHPAPAARPSAPLRPMAPESRWTRLRRNIFGIAKPLLEE